MVDISPYGSDHSSDSSYELRECVGMGRQIGC